MFDRNSFLFIYLSIYLSVVWLRIDEKGKMQFQFLVSPHSRETRSFNQSISNFCCFLNPHLFNCLDHTLWHVVLKILDQVIVRTCVPSMLNSWKIKKTACCFNTTFDWTTCDGHLKSTRQSSSCFEKLWLAFKLLEFFAKFLFCGCCMDLVSDTEL